MADEMITVVAMVIYRHGNLNWINVVVMVMTLISRLLSGAFVCHDECGLGRQNLLLVINLQGFICENEIISIDIMYKNKYNKL